MWGVHTKNHIKIRFLGVVLRPIRPSSTFRPKNQNKSKLRRNAWKLSSPLIYIVWSVHKKNQLKIRFLGDVLCHIRLFTRFDRKIRN